MSSHTPGSSQPSQIYKVLSDKPPEEARIFGLRGADIQAIWVPHEEEAPVIPDDVGFTRTIEHGLCKFCQLLLAQRLPEGISPSIIAHQPNLLALISSPCQVCSWISVSIKRGCPELAKRFQQGDPSLCSTESTTSGITLSISRDPKYTRAIDSVGARGYFAETGVPLNITTLAKLGEDPHSVIYAGRALSLYPDRAALHTSVLAAIRRTGD